VRFSREAAVACAGVVRFGKWRTFISPTRRESSRRPFCEPGLSQDALRSARCD